MADFIRTETRSQGLNTPVVLYECEGFRDFLAIVEQLRTEAAAGIIPLVQIECHGDLSAGLIFANGSELSWASLSEALLRLNLATGFNLLAVVSACYGAHFIGNFLPVEPAPCYALISPTAEVTPFEIRTGLQAFYREFLSNPDMGVAVQNLTARELPQGRWFAMAAEGWFERAVRGYLENHCTRHAVIERSRKMNQRLLEMGRPQLSQRKLFEIFRRTQADIVIRLFTVFFSIGAKPGNMERFADCYARTEAWFLRIKARGTHIL
jgi:hypothetical protein